MKQTIFTTALCVAALTFNGSLYVAETFKSAYANEKLAKAQQGDAVAQYSLCVGYELSSEWIDNIKDLNKAIAWCEKAATQRHIGAMINLAGIYYKEKRYSKAFALWQKLAQTPLEDYIEYKRNQFGNQNADANKLERGARFAKAEQVSNLAMLYMNGIGTEKNYRQAKYWAEYGVNELGYKTSYPILGDLYQYGWGVRVNKSKAIELYGEVCDTMSDQHACDQYRKLSEQGY